ncbi:MAG: hypothetical protein IIW94_04555 [Clostridia bacterium]|nr:hypothetical protein [Clostridia bacterium]
MRSKTLIVANIFATVWTGIMLYSAIAFFAKGGTEYFVLANYANSLLNDLLGSLEELQIFMTLLNVLSVFVALHTFLFTLAIIFGWIGYICKGAGFALSAAILYLVGTLLCPIFILSGLPIIILGFVGQACQRKLNKAHENTDVIT